MRRRDFITFAGGAALAWPDVAKAQRSPTIGFLGSATPDAWQALVTAFKEGLRQGGFTEGENVQIEYRWAQDQYGRMPALAAELVERQVAVIVAAGGTRSIQASMVATNTIPIVFVTGSDPIRLGLVSSLERPGGNATGIMLFSPELAAKRLELLRELVPAESVVAVLINPSSPVTDPDMSALPEAAQALGRQLQLFRASAESDIDAAFASIAQLKPGALVVHVDPFLLSQRDKIAALASEHRVPTVFGLREFVVAGGLMSYGTSIAGAFQQAGGYTARILNGAKPDDLPVVQPTKFELVVNLKAAKAIGFTVPAGILARADELIE